MDRPHPGCWRRWPTELAAWSTWAASAALERPLQVGRESDEISKQRGRNFYAQLTLILVDFDFVCAFAAFLAHLDRQSSLGWDDKLTIRNGTRDKYNRFNTLVIDCYTSNHKKFSTQSDDGLTDVLKCTKSVLILELSSAFSRSFWNLKIRWAVKSRQGYFLVIYFFLHRSLYNSCCFISFDLFSFFFMQVMNAKINFIGEPRTVIRSN